MYRLLLPAVLLVVPVVITGQASPSATETARTLQQKYDQVKDFTADFTHTYEGGVLKKKTTERGNVQVKKPGKMRWEYTSPEKKAIVSNVPSDDEATTAVLFLAGKGNLLRDFNVVFAEAPTPGTVALRLNPKSKQRDYDWLVITVDRTSMQIRG